MNKLKTIFRSLHWKNILGLTIAGLINAFGITIFLVLLISMTVAYPVLPCY